MFKLIWLYCLLFILSAVINGCGKKNNPQPVITVTTWTIQNITYTATITSFNNGDLSAMDGNVITLPEITIQFNFTVPTAATLSAANAAINATPAPGQCLITTKDTNGNLFFSSGGTVKTIVNNGKLTAVFKDIPMVKQNGTAGQGNPVYLSAGTITGMLIEH